MNPPLHIARRKSHPARPLAVCVRAFSLVELLVVIALMAILAVLVVPAMTGAGGKGTERAFYDVADAVAMARSHAIANGTYVYLGFAEYDGSTLADGALTPGDGRVVFAAISSKDGTRGYADTSAANALSSWKNSYGQGGNFSVVIKPQILDNVDLVALGEPPTTGSMARPDPGNDAWRLGSTSFKTDTQTPFSLPLGAALGAGKYNFDQVLVFLPNGSVARQTSYSGLGQVSPLWFEIALRPRIGNTNNYAAISINGTTGATKIHRP